jgi:sulfide:quinone oxidoreductase
MEAALALRELGGEHLSIAMLTPEDHFEIRALSVRDPFGHAPPQRHALAELAQDAGFELLHGALASVDADARTVVDDAGTSHAYDALLVCVGARPRRALEHTTTFAGPQDAEAVHGVLQDLEEGAAKRVAFVVPPGASWSLPMYELALMTAERVRSLGLDEVAIMVVTPERSPLELFGPEASAAVGELLSDRGVALLNSTAVGPETRVPAIDAAGRALPVDRIVALPVLEGPAIAGLPADEHGFLPVDDLAQVRGVERVWAAGDGTDFTIKQGGVAAQMADTAATGIAAAAGAGIAPTPFRPVLRGILLTGDAPTWLRTEADGSDPVSAVAEHALWWPPTKVAGPRLAPFLWRREEGEAAAAPPPPPDADGVHVDRPVGDDPLPQPRRTIEIVEASGRLELLERRG